MAEQRAQQLTQARKKRGYVRARLTCLGDRITRLESKELTATDRPEINWIETTIYELNAEFRTLHDDMIELMEDSAEALQTQQDACDAYDAKAAEYL